MRKGWQPHRTALKLASSFPVSGQTGLYPTETENQTQPSAQESSQCYSSPNRISAKTTFDKPARSMSTSVMSDIRSAILSRKVPTIKPTPKFRTVSARNRLLAIASLYIITLTWLCPYLWERVRELEAVLTLCNSFIYHTGGMR